MLTIGDLLQNYIFEGFGQLMMKGDSILSAFKVTFGLLLLCSIVIYGIIFISNGWGKFKNLVKTLVWALFALGLVSQDVYFGFVIEPVVTVRDRLSIFLMTGDAGTIFQAVQESFAKLMGFGFSLIDSGGMTNLTPVLIGAVVLLISGLYYLVIVANFLFCDLALYILFFFGMLIIPLGAFESARPMFKSWCSAIAKYVGVFIMTGALVSIIDGAMRPLLQEVINESYSDGGYGGGVSMIFLGAVLALGSFGIYLLFKSMELTTEITGGVMSDGAAGSTSIVNSTKTTLNALKSGGNVANSLRKLKQGSTGT